MITDIYMITRFYAAGQYGYAYANIAMIGANWLIQLLIVWSQTGRNILGTAFLKEALIATVGLKPGLDAWNVCSGKEQQPGQTFDPMLEVRIGRVKGVGGRWGLKHFFLFPPLTRLTSPRPIALPPSL